VPQNKDDEDPEDEALGRSRGGFSTKIHIAVDALGNPLRFEGSERPLPLNSRR
jgi:hypothetical protein